MFRFCRITTFLHGATFIDYSDLMSWQEIKAELENGPLEGRVEPYGHFPYQDFIIYEAA